MSVWSDFMVHRQYKENNFWIAGYPAGYPVSGHTGYPAGYPVTSTGYPAGYRIAKMAGYPVHP